MTEAEAIGALASLGDQIYAGVDTWFTVTFGYLAVAYFVGTKLSRFQCIAVSTLYAVAAFLYAIALPIHTHAWTLLMLREQTVYDQTLFANAGLSWVVGSACIFVAGTVLALYFMYNVRRAGTA